MQGRPAALITGGSEGIGLEFANELARSGFDLVIASRSQEKLNNATETIKHSNKEVNTKSIAIDFAKASPSEIRKFFDDATEAYPNLRILVNNVGIIKLSNFFDTDP